MMVGVPRTLTTSSFVVMLGLMKEICSVLRGVPASTLVSRVGIGIAIQPCTTIAENKMSTLRRLKSNPLLENWLMRSRLPRLGGSIAEEERRNVSRNRGAANRTSEDLWGPMGTFLRAREDGVVGLLCIGGKKRSPEVLEVPGAELWCGFRWP